jgi:hypothetical protein
VSDLWNSVWPSWNPRKQALFEKYRLISACPLVEYERFTHKSVNLKDTAVKKQLKDINIKALCFKQLDIISHKLDGILAERKENACSTN